MSGGGLPHGLVDLFGDVDQGGPTQLKGKRTSGGSVLSPKVRMQGRDAAKEKAHGFTTRGPLHAFRHHEIAWI